MTTPIHLPGLRNITVSGRIGSGATTLAEKLSQAIGWPMLDGGKIFREFSQDHGYAKDRPDDFDLAYEEKVKSILREKTHHIVQSHLAGFDAYKMRGIFKILVSCEDWEGNDKADIRIDRLVNRDKMTVEDAKREVLEREEQNLFKWRKLYGNDNKAWIYWDKKYYDFIVNTFSHNKEESLVLVLEAVGYRG